MHASIHVPHVHAGVTGPGGSVCRQRAEGVCPEGCRSKINCAARSMDARKVATGPPGAPVHVLCCARQVPGVAPACRYHASAQQELKALL
jgi:hypothetical protein